MSTTIDSLQIEITQDSQQAMNGLDALTASLGRLKAASRGGVGLTAVSNQLKKLNDAVNTMQNPSTKISQLVSALKPLESIGKSNLNSTMNSLKKLPEITKQLAAIDMGAFATQINRVVIALKPLADEMNKVAAGFSAFPSRIQRLITQNEKLSTSNVKTGKSFGVMGTGISSLQAKFGIYYLAFRKLANIMANWITESNDYVENLNLFTVAMGNHAKEAFRYGQAVQKAMGIDSSEWMRNQGIFMQITTGFGVVEDKAYQMSKTLTQIGYDMSSFFNRPIEEAMQKVQSGIAGELEPLRRWGYALDVATLQQIAYNHGITQNINTMTQAQKSQLRFIAIMEQSKNVMGDMGRTLITPANALRILNQQLTLLARGLGNMIIPLLIEIIPYVQAFVQVLAEAANWVANLFGFSLPTIDYSGLEGLTSGAEEVTDGLEDATDAANKLKSVTSGFDELNIISPNTDSGTGVGSSGGGYDLGLDLSEYDYDFLSQIDTKVQEITAKIKSWFADFKENPAIKAISDAFTFLWNNGIKPLGEWIISHPNEIVNFIVAIGVAIATYKIVTSISSIVGLLKGTGGLVSLLGGLGSILTNPWAVAIAAVAGAIALIASSIATAQKNAQEADLANRFGDIALSLEEVKYWADRLTSSDLTIKLDLFGDESVKIDEIKTRVEAAVKTLNGYNFRISLGMDISETEYRSTIDTFIESAKEYIQQKQIVASLAVEVLLDGTSTGNRLREFVSTFYSTTYTELERLGKDLKQVVSDGFVDGKWIPDKFKEAVKLQKEIQETLDYISTVEFEAKIAALKMDFKGTDLTVDSFKSVLDEAHSTIEEQLSDLEAIRLENIKIAKMEFDQTGNKKAYDEALATIESEFNNKKLALNFKTFEFGMETLQEAFANELTKAEPVFGTTFKDAFRNGFIMGARNPEEIYQMPLEGVLSDLQMAYNVGMQDLDISSAARKNIENLVKELQPTKTQYEEIAAAALVAGKSVPEEVNKGLSDINKLEAISGSMRSQSYMIGEMLSTDTSFLNLLAISKNAGERINREMAKGLSNNLKFVTDTATGVVTGIKNSITGEVVNVTPILVENLKTLGIDIATGLEEGVDEGVVEEEYRNIFQRIGDWFKNLFGINSPSTVFHELGSNLSQGLLNGVDDQINTDKKKWDIWSLLPWNWFSSTNEISSNKSSLFNRGGKTVMNSLLGGMDGFDNKFKTIFQNAVEAARTVFNKFIDWLNSKMRFEWDAITIAGITIVPAGSVQLFTIPHIPKLFAEGGFPETGELFIAREAGAEMVGSIGGRTAVANNDQIVDGIAAGVYEANGEQNVLLREQNALLRAILEKGTTINLDGKEITKKVEKVQRERGTTLLPGGVAVGW